MRNRNQENHTVSSNEQTLLKFLRNLFSKTYADLHKTQSLDIGVFNLVKVLLDCPDHLFFKDFEKAKRFFDISKLFSVLFLRIADDSTPTNLNLIYYLELRDLIVQLAGLILADQKNEYRRLISSNYSLLEQLLVGEDKIINNFDSISLYAFRNTVSRINRFEQEYFPLNNDTVLVTLGNGCTPVGVLIKLLRPEIEWLPIRFSMHKGKDKSPVYPAQWLTYVKSLIDQGKTIVIWDEDTTEANGLIELAKFIKNQILNAKVYIFANQITTSSDAIIRAWNEGVEG